MDCNLVNVIITASEKAANIARSCRENEDLFRLLVEEKKGDEANTRFFQDFKTLADVLIQETVRHDIKQHFPTLGDYIFGEESNVFTNTLGETIEVKVCSNESETGELLEKVLDGNKRAANLLAAEVHKTINLQNVNIGDIDLPSNVHFDIDNLGLWIDPIDSTAEYISAKETKDNSGIYLTGLRCVTVLIGVYNKNTGIPIMGVVNQPFHQNTNQHWYGKCYWGIQNSKSICSIENSESENKLITLSRIEIDEMKVKLLESGYNLVEAAGAGYKLLNVITGTVDVYVVSQGTTYRWDTCGPHAILRSLGGGIYDYTKAINGEIIEIDYKDITDMDNQSKTKKYCNKNGLIAVRNKETLKTILHILCK